MPIPLILHLTLGCSGVVAEGELPHPRREAESPEGRRGRKADVPAEGVKTRTDARLFEVEDAVARQAVCNNGEPATYYVTPGKGDGATKFVIFIPGGGSCYTLEDCKARVKEQPGLMAPRTGLHPPGDGIISDDPERNPDFHAWSKVYIHYCSSDVFIGDRGASEDTGGFHFRGHRIFKAVVEDLKAHPGEGSLSTATEVILVGASAGGMAVQHNLDRLAGWLPQARVAGLSDAATFGSFYEDREPTPEEIAKLRKRMEDRGASLENNFWHPVVDDTCRATLGSAANSCATASGLRGQFIETPLFLAQDQKDAKYMRAHGLERGTPEGEKAGAEIVASLEAWPWGAFSTDKGAHGLCKHDKWTGVTIVHTDKKRYSMAEVFGNWYFDRPGPKKVIAR